MRTDMTRTARLLLVLALSAAGAGAAAGCGTAEAGRTEPAPSPRSKDRAHRVAEAWDGSRAAAQWRAGYHPVAPVVQLPAGGLRDDADRRAYATGTFDLKAPLPSARGKSGRVTWKDGGSLTRPLVAAERAYRALDGNSAPGPRLTVTKAESGDMTVLTSRGPATVPAWLFTLEGYATPLKTAAVNPSEVPKSPVAPLGQDVPTDVLAPLGGLTKVAEDGRSVTVVAHHGSCDDGPVVTALETRGSVVLSASVTGTDDGPCTSDLRGEKVTVKLDRPVGDRVVLDAFTGRPVPYTEWPGAAPGRS
ncbi:hypothetical protein [Streptomyces coeruleorubidus]|uniref:Lipoprotein n=1 Tax=Streptomyces coeruleorubidus TaxID=116188 RepID=A0A5J6IIF3_STRC4|nr:hypothetical protein [Streptomyces coeruleorubidus]QEV28567.1 hypothetical protein CP976_33600 [Streptomyces coeruleorubidus]GGT58381.1 hypothetical protein GCM10010256_14180 [Streptomyces coeruleorubidus]